MLSDIKQNWKAATSSLLQNKWRQETLVTTTDELAANSWCMQSDRLWCNIWLTTETLRVQYSTDPLRTTFSQFYVLCTQANSASNPQQDRKWVVA